VQRNRSSSFKRVPARIEDALILAGLVALLLFARTGATAPPGRLPIGAGGRPEDHGLPARGPHEAGHGGGRWPHVVPLIGEVQVSGLTQTELDGRLGKDYLVDPQVSVTVQEYRSQKVFVMGEAEKPGTYPLTGRAG
jgi:hypothetical protein